MVFFKKCFVADSNQIAVSYCIGWVEFRYSKSSGHLNQCFAVGAKNMDFLVFCEFL
jgi:hypothetical protein